MRAVMVLSSESPKDEYGPRKAWPFHIYCAFCQSWEYLVLAEMSRARGHRDWQEGRCARCSNTLVKLVPP